MKHHFFISCGYKGFKRNCKLCGENAQNKVHLLTGKTFDYKEVAVYFNWDLNSQRTGKMVAILNSVQKRLFPKLTRLANKNKWLIIATAKKELDEFIKEHGPVPEKEVEQFD